MDPDRIPNAADDVCREPQTLDEWKSAYFVVLKRAQEAEAVLDAERRARGDMAAVMVERMKERDEARAVLAKLKACMGDAAAAASDTILKVSAERDRALALLSDLSDATWDCGWRGEIVQRAKALLEGADREHTK